MPTFLVTGAAGFIGAAIAKALIKEENTVITIDNLSTGYVESIPEGCCFIMGDVFDANVLEKLTPYKFDAIIHIAGQSSGEVSFEDPIYDLNTNVQSVIMLLEIAKKTKCKKFIYASTMSVYGDSPIECVNEESSVAPKSFYAVGKLASEHYMKLFSQYGIACTALRLFNVYGPGQNMKNMKQGMASIFLAMAIKNRKILVKGSLERFRDFIYIDDVVDAVRHVLLKEQINQFEVYNVSTGVKTTVGTLINEISKNLQFDFSVETVGGTAGDQHGIYGENTKIKRLLGWDVRYSLKEGMSKMVEWAQSSANY